MSLKWSNMHSTNKGILIAADLRKSPFYECLSTMSGAYLTSLSRQSRLWHRPRIGFCSQCFLFLCLQPLHMLGPDPTTYTFPHALFSVMYSGWSIIIGFCCVNSLGSLMCGTLRSLPCLQSISWYQLKNEHRLDCLFHLMSKISKVVMKGFTYNFCVFRENNKNKR